jgi:hypothetical protein
MTDTTQPRAADELLRRKGTFPSHTKLVAALDRRVAHGEKEYGEKLTINSTVNGEPITKEVALTEARDELIDALLYACVALEFEPDTSDEVVNVAIRYGVMALEGLQRAIDVRVLTAKSAPQEGTD